MNMLNLYEFRGSGEYETEFGTESIELDYDLILAEDADESLLEDAAKALAAFITAEHIDRGFDPSHYN